MTGIIEGIIEGIIIRAVINRKDKVYMIVSIVAIMIIICIFALKFACAGCINYAFPSNTITNSNSKISDLGNVV